MFESAILPFRKAIGRSRPPGLKKSACRPFGMGIYWLRSHMRRQTLIFTLSLFALFITVNSGLQAQQPVKRHRIAVLDFNDAPVMGSSQAVFGRQLDVGKGLADLLIDRLVSDGTYDVIERDRIDNVLTEHDFLNSNLTDPQTAARMGHILGVDAVVVGQVTQFGWDGAGGNPEAKTADSSASKDAAGPPARKAVVAFTAELIDCNTGQTLATANSKGVSRRTGTKLLESGSAGNVAMDSGTFAQSMIGEATTAAVGQMAKELEGENGILSTWAPPPLRGEITDASKPNIIINVGSAAGLKVGDKMLVTRVVHVERDKVTETAVGAVEDEMGVLTITSVQFDSATGHFSGPAAPKVGDQVRPLQ